MPSEKRVKKHRKSRHEKKKGTKRRKTSKKIIKQAHKATFESGYANNKNHVTGQDYSIVNFDDHFNSMVEKSGTIVPRELIKDLFPSYDAN